MNSFYTKKVILEADTFVWDGSQLQGIVVLRGIPFLDIGSLKISLNVTLTQLPISNPGSINRV